MSQFILTMDRFPKISDDLVPESIKSDQGCSVITVTNRLNYVNSIFNNYNRQNHLKKEMIIVLNNNKLNLNSFEAIAKKYTNIKVFKLDEKITLGQCKNFAFEKTSMENIAFFDDDDFYGPNYLTHSLVALEQIDSDIIGKKCYYIYFEKNKTLTLFLPHKENQFVSHVADSSLVLKRKLLEEVKFPDLEGAGAISRFQKTCVQLGYTIYSADRFNYVIHRHPNPQIQHTWKIEENRLLKLCSVVEKDLTDYTKYVIR